MAEATREDEKVENQRREAPLTHGPNGQGPEDAQATPLVDGGLRVALNQSAPGGRAALPPQLMPRMILGLQRASGNAAVEEWLRTAMARPAEPTAATDSGAGQTDDGTTGSTGSTESAGGSWAASGSNGADGSGTTGTAAAPPGATEAAAPKSFAKAAPEAATAPTVTDAGTLELAGSRSPLPAPAAGPTAATDSGAGQTDDGTTGSTGSTGSTESAGGSWAVSGSNGADGSGTTGTAAAPPDATEAAAPKSFAKAAPEGTGGSQSTFELALQDEDPDVRRAAIV